MAPLRLVFCLLILTGLGLVLLSNANTAVALNLLGFTSRSLPLSIWMLAALVAGLTLSLFFEGLFALTRWQPRNPKDPRDIGPGPRPRSGYAEDDEFVEENFSVPQRDRYSRPDPESPWDDPAWVEPDRGYRDRPYDSPEEDPRDDRMYDKRDYNRKAYGESAYDQDADRSYNDRGYNDRGYNDRATEDDYQAPPFKAEPKHRPVEPPIDRPIGGASRPEDRVYDADFRILDDNNPRPEPLRRAQEEPVGDTTPRRGNRSPDKPSPANAGDWDDWNDNDLDW